MAGSIRSQADQSESAVAESHPVLWVDGQRGGIVRDRILVSLQEVVDIAAVDQGAGIRPFSETAFE